MSEKKEIPSLIQLCLGEILQQIRPNFKKFVSKYCLPIWSIKPIGVDCSKWQITFFGLSWEFTRLTYTYILDLETGTLI